VSKMESALLIPFPETEATVSPHREELDPSATIGIPAHVTLLSPFLDPDEIDETVEDRLRTLFRARDPFQVTFKRTRRFPDVLWLAPSPPGPFRSLTRTLCAEFPPLQPYGGRFTADEATPHLTVGDGMHELDMDDIAALLRPGLPIHAMATEAWLMVGSDEHWELRSRYPLIG